MGRIINNNGRNKSKNKAYLNKGSRKKSSSLNGRAIKRGGGGLGLNGPDIREELFCGFPNQIRISMHWTKEHAKEHTHTFITHSALPPSHIK